MIDDLDKLTRWSDSGAHWRVVVRTPERVTVDLLTCTGGEVVDRLISSNRELLDWLGDRESSED